MAYDEGLAQILRDALAQETGVTEKKMFGGLCFLLNGNMVCGVHRHGAMFRVGKVHEPAAIEIPGAAPLAFTGRAMKGMIEVVPEALSYDERVTRWMELALGFVRTLSPK